MREILFRGKRLDNGEWVGGMLGQYHEGLKATIVCNHLGVLDFPLDLICVDPATVGQYTGLTDKHGKRIYEGDMLEPFDDEIDKMVVEFHEGTFMLCLYGDRGYRSESGDWVYDGSNYGVIECEPLSSYGDEIMVIGTVHDNPELLKGGDQ